MAEKGTRLGRRLAGWVLLAALFLTIQPAQAADTSADHRLTYTTGALTWDSGTTVDADGAARIALFDSQHQNVVSDNGEGVFAPGTRQTNTVRLENRTGYAITYTAVVYRIKEEDTLPVAPLLAEGPYTPATTWPLPEGVAPEQVTDAVTGTLAGNTAEDFSLVWQWDYYQSDDRDQTDTALGDRAASEQADRVEAGVYIVVEEDRGGSRQTITPSAPPATGTAGDGRLSLAVTVVSGGILCAMYAVRRRKRP